MEIKKAEGWSKAGNEFIFNTEAFAKFVIILEENFYSDLFFPHLGSDASLDVLDRRYTVDLRNWMKIKLRDWVAACLKMEVISYIIYWWEFNSNKNDWLA